MNTEEIKSRWLSLLETWMIKMPDANKIYLIGIVDGFYVLEVAQNPGELSIFNEARKQIHELL